MLDQQFVGVLLKPELVLLFPMNPFRTFIKHGCALEILS
jgi:hypothetical protein